MFNWQKDLVGQGIALTLLLHLLIQTPMALATYGISLLLIGFSQLFYLAPITAIAHQRGYDGIVKGLVIAASLTFLLNAIGVMIVFGMGF